MGLETLIGESPAMQEVFSRIGEVAGLDHSVLILGELGTETELVAREIHKESHRHGPFQAFRCAGKGSTDNELFGSVADGSAEGGLVLAAHGGSLFLDEFGELSLGAQAKLLRVLEERTLPALGQLEPRPVDVRFIFSTNRDLDRAVSEGRFSRPLHGLARACAIALPPLRERAHDILLLAQAFVERLHPGGALDFSESARQALLSYPFPGNVQQLESMVTLAVKAIELAFEAMGVAVSIEPRHLSLDDPLTNSVEAKPKPSHRLQPGDMLSRGLLRRMLRDELAALREVGELDSEGVLTHIEGVLVARLDEKSQPRKWHRRWRVGRGLSDLGQFHRSEAREIAVDIAGLMPVTQGRADVALVKLLADLGVIQSVDLKWLEGKLRLPSEDHVREVPSGVSWRVPPRSSLAAPRLEAAGELVFALRRCIDLLEPLVAHNENATLAQGVHALEQCLMAIEEQHGVDDDIEGAGN